jgi:hypothetical protein
MFRVTNAVAVVATAALTGYVGAATVVQYDAANNGVSSMAPVVTAAEVSADNMVAGSGLSTESGSTWNFKGWDGASFAGSVSSNDLWRWGFDVVQNVEIDLTTMDIRLDRSGTGPDDFEIQASVNGGTPVSLLTHNYNDSTSGVNFLNVSLASLGTVELGDSVVFTLAAYNAENAGAGTFDLENITFPGGNDGIVIKGDITPVPEPAALSLLGLGTVAVLRRRRQA